MCGINGIVKGSTNQIRKMNQLIIHRGPDGQGEYVDKNIALGHLRLKIIDLSKKAAQPMWSKDKQYAIVFNGEIYNYKSVKNSLKDLDFQNKSDTEVILNGYRKWGEKVLEELDGMFAFCIYDKKKNILFCARDRIGEKPFYYIQEPSFAFSSEIKALLTLKQPKINEKALDEFITFEDTFGKETIFEGVYELEPASFLVYSFKDRTIEIKKYWDVKIEVDENKDQDTWIGEIRDLLDRSVKSRLVSDVAVGTYLSGGIDSSAVTHYCGKYLPYKTHAFSLVFDDKKVKSEEEFMQDFLKENKNVVEHFVKLDSKFYWENFAKATWYNDYPLVYPAQVAQYLLAKEAKKYITVVLSGEGGDEVFGGYDRHTILFPHLFNYRGAGSVYIYKAFQIFSFILKKPLNLFANSFFEPTLVRALAVNYFHDLRKRKLYGNRLQDKIEPIEKRVNRIVNKERFKGGDFLAFYLKQEIKTYLQTLLHKQDRMNMAFGVECRVPILSEEMINRFINIPYRDKIGSKEGKIIFKRALEGIIPQKILKRKKEGFNIPIDHYLEDISWGKGVLKNSMMVEDGFFNQSAIDKFLLSKDAKGTFILLAVEVWYRLFIRNIDNESIFRDLVSN